DSLADILEQYATLIESYKRLKSEYEEEREGRERYKQLARGHERNPFALVIVDGDGYVFNESLILEGEEGGIRAAKQLNDTIKTRTMPCPQRGACRKLNCIYGHVCQKADCRRRCGKASCRFSFNTCTGDFEMNSLIPVTVGGTNGEDTHSTGRIRSPVEESEDGVSILDAAS
ncbi:hypothetical protein B0J13DRAFT_462358, partial [Dactylonectria estremocensis]